MKKIVMTLMTSITMMTAQAYEYPYLVFQKADGTTQAVAVDALTISVSDGQLVATNAGGTQTFTLSTLSKMYFSADGATGIQALKHDELSADADIYDLQGRKVSRDQMHRGIYVVKTQSGTYKVNVR